MAHGLKASDLGQFTGTCHWYRHALNRNVLYTDGVAYVAEAGGAYWLTDEIALAQMRAAVRAEDFQTWTLTKAANESAVLACDDGNGCVVYRKRIDYTDFPLPEIKFFFRDNVLMLPSEY